jgi:hypothetical protein
MTVPLLHDAGFADVVIEGNYTSQPAYRLRACLYFPQEIVPRQ